MDHTQAVALIRGGVAAPGRTLAGKGTWTKATWADLGAGTGVFTRALSELLGPSGTVYAVDRDALALTRLKEHAPPGAAIIPYRADFTGIDALEALFAASPADGFDGLLLANSLHFVARQERLLQRVTRYLNPQGRLLLVEYDVKQRSPWNPYPVPLARFQRLAAAAKLSSVRELSRRPSKFGDRELYAAVAYKGAERT